MRCFIPFLGRVVLFSPFIPSLLFLLFSPSPGLAFQFLTWLSFWESESCIHCSQVFVCQICGQEMRWAFRGEQHLDKSVCALGGLRSATGILLCSSTSGRQACPNPLPWIPKVMWNERGRIHWKSNNLVTSKGDLSLGGTIWRDANLRK